MCEVRDFTQQTPFLEEHWKNLKNGIKLTKFSQNIRVGNNKMKSTKTILKEQVKAFRNWWAENYTLEAIKELLTDDPGYPNWLEIEIFFGKLIENKEFVDLDEEDQINLLWLIARNWDLGNMIAWLTKGSQLSLMGKMQKTDFVMLSKTLLKLNHPEFNDAKSQIVFSFQKFEKLTPEIETILLKFYEDEDEYTKRLSLMTLGKLGYHDIKNLINQSWRIIDDEHYKIGCLWVINENIKDNELMKNYLSLADKEKGEYLKEYVIQLRLNKNYQ